jgi:uncharacterized protein
VALILRAADRCAVAWKNGGGVTREVFVQPPGSDFGSFDWRLSLAEVGIAGPFSAFNGVERHMAVLSGRLDLTLQGRTLNLDSSSAPLSFAGELAIHAAPRDGVVTDLNLMVRRAHGTGRLTRHSAAAPVSVTSGAGATVIIALGALTMRMPGGHVEPLDALDAALLHSGPYRLAAADPAGTPHFWQAGIIPVDRV